MDPQAGQPVQAVPVPNVPVPNADAADAPPVAHVAPPDIPAADAQQGAADADPMPVLAPDPMLNAPPREMTRDEVDAVALTLPNNGNLTSVGQVYNFCTNTLGIHSRCLCHRSHLRCSRLL